MSNRFPEAQRQAQELVGRQRARLGADHPLTCYTVVLLASVLGYTEHGAQAVPLARQAALCLANKLGASNIRTAAAYQVLGDLHFQADEYAEAAVAYDEVARSYASLLGPQGQRTINVRMNAAVARQYAGRADVADGELTAILDTARASLGWTHPTVQSVRYHLADCRLDQKRTDGVGPLLEGLSTEALNEAQIEPDWEGRLAYERGRLALYSGETRGAILLLEKAATITAEKHPDGRVSEKMIRQLIETAKTSSERHRTPVAN
jgi:non-specific serine/threonine protein kinase